MGLHPWTKWFLPSFVEHCVKKTSSNMCWFRYQFWCRFGLILFAFFSLSHERRLFKLDLPLGIPYFPHFLLCLIRCCFFLNHFTQLSFLLPCCCKKKTKLYLDSLWISWEVLTPDFLFKTWMQPIHFELKHSLYIL